MTDKKSFTYAGAGVDIDRADQAKGRIKKLIESTYNDKVIGGFGQFGGCYSGKFEGYTDPITVSSSDGVGTKIKIAIMMQKYDTVGIDIVQADALILWITEPDGSAHSKGVGAPLTITALKVVDQEMGRIIDGLEIRGILTSTNILITSDHGFSTRTGKMSVSELLVKQGLKSKYFNQSNNE